MKTVFTEKCCSLSEPKCPRQFMATTWRSRPWWWISENANKGFFYRERCFCIEHGCEEQGGGGYFLLCVAGWNLTRDQTFRCLRGWKKLLDELNYAPAIPCSFLLTLEFYVINLIVRSWSVNIRWKDGTPGSPLEQMVILRALAAVIYGNPPQKLSCIGGGLRSPKFFSS